MTIALETDCLSKSFAGQATPAVDNLSMRVECGAVYGFLGANGAGKTTSLRLILGLLRPDRGAIRLFGAPGTGHCRVGALIETPFAYPHLTGHENLDISRRLLRLPRREIDRVLEIVDLRHAASQHTGGYSLGMRQRLGIARALLGRPRVLILDEPTNGLDPAGIRDMRTLLCRLPQVDDVTLIVSSHLLSEVEQVATHVGMLHRGRLLVEDRLSALLEDANEVEVGTGDQARSVTILGAAGLSAAPEPSTGLLLVRGAEPADIVQLLVRHGHSLWHVARRRASLERLYHQHVAAAA